MTEHDTIPTEGETPSERQDYLAMLALAMLLREEALKGFLNTLPETPEGIATGVSGLQRAGFSQSQLAQMAGCTTRKIKDKSPGTEGWAKIMRGVKGAINNRRDDGKRLSTLLKGMKTMQHTIGTRIFRQLENRETGVEPADVRTILQLIVATGITPEMLAFTYGRTPGTVKDWLVDENLIAAEALGCHEILRRAKRVLWERL